MKIRHWMTVIALFALVIATVVGVFLTNDADRLLPVRMGKNGASKMTAVVDQKQPVILPLRKAG